MAPGDARRPAVGNVVRVRFSKWGRQPHWGMDLRYLGSDEYGRWLGAPTGFWMSRPGRALASDVDVAILIPEDAPFVASFNGPGHDTCDIYVDVTTVPVWGREDEEAVVRAVDLDLDVYRDLAGATRIDDEDEFAEHQVSYGYPQDTIDLARRSCHDVASAIEAEEEPWRSVGHRWVCLAARSVPVPRRRAAGIPRPAGPGR